MASSFERASAIQNPPRVNNPRGRLRHSEYIAQAPAGGVPALTGAAPGKANCGLFFIGELETLEQDTDATGPMTDDVYNLSTQEIAEDTYFPVVEVGNRLCAMAAGGGVSCQDIIRLIGDPTCDICAALCAECEFEGCFPTAKLRLVISGFQNCDPFDSPNFCSGEQMAQLNGTYTFTRIKREDGGDDLGITDGETAVPGNTFTVTIDLLDNLGENTTVDYEVTIDNDIVGETLIWSWSVGRAGSLPMMEGSWTADPNSGQKTHPATSCGQPTGPCDVEDCTF